jgi:hypothetical protein
LRKIFLLSADPNHRHIHRIPSHSEGRIAIVTDAGWDVVDAAALARKVIAGRASARERTTGAQTNGANAYGKTVWFWHPLLMLNWRRRVGPTGLRQSIFADDGDKTNSSPRRARHKP